MIDPKGLAVELLKAPTERDLQVKIGASNLAQPCARCLADALLASRDDQDRPYWLGAVLGTAAHNYLESRIKSMHPEMEPERRVVLGEIPGYGVVKSTTDLYIGEPHFQVVDWKGLALDTLLPTPDGWTTMGEVSVGDTLIDRSGNPTRVIGKSEVKHRDCYRLTFQDGTSVVSDDEHLWFVTEAQQTKERVVSSQYLFERGVVGTRQRDIRITNSAPFIGVTVELPIDPYVFGVWLGDGASDCGRITNTTEEVWKEIERRGRIISGNCAAKNRAETRNVLGLNRELRLLGVKNNKHIPMQYLRAGYEQRLDLLRGYMDADGYYNPVRKRAAMQTTRKQQADDIAALVRTFGWSCKVHQINVSWQGGRKIGWSVEFTPDVNPFLARNQDVVFRPLRGHSARRILKTIERVESVPTQCIMVDSPDQSYLCTESWLPTHNTTTRKKLPNIKQALTTEPTEYDSTEMAEVRYKVTGYKYQLLTYGRGMVLAGKRVDTVSLGFICRDGVGDADIWGWSMPYDAEAAERVWNRLERLWAWLQAGNDPNELTSATGCYTCAHYR